VRNGRGSVRNLVEIWLKTKPRRPARPMGVETGGRPSRAASNDTDGRSRSLVQLNKAVLPTQVTPLAGGCIVLLADNGSRGGHMSRRQSHSTVERFGSIR
jgi:hypothetical protein